MTGYTFDEYIAKLLVVEAQKKNKLNERGESSSQASNAQKLRPNTNFLNNMMRNVRSHNMNVENRSDDAKERSRRAEKGKQRRREVSPSPSGRLSRRRDVSPPPTRKRSKSCEDEENLSCSQERRESVHGKRHARHRAVHKPN
ncbi:fungal protein [Schizosaccharomyces cryophilus OY26]|uniref:Fungal protein n=1 Tax=Schizosaccharomyces cryophilus (strain OY26 / ATCC MYA-4695 / CBS 11777 / NBRC 106824 / NRRL Y48691) TaxID=653667 RepID=S9XDK7_SCHCR|nr:uncharacterized protein SPOG_00249 [Schizosaccharomyces cryophilus OY26]EPY51826.1 fungal protein [Schizosaccharomyces cryophilus OY26]